MTLSVETPNEQQRNTLGKDPGAEPNVKIVSAFVLVLIDKYQFACFETQCPCFFNELILYFLI
jgi:hypothetical protein